MKRPQGRTEPGLIDQRVRRKCCTKRLADESGSTSTEVSKSICYKHRAAKCVSVRRETVSDEGPQRLFYIGALLQCSQQEKGFDSQVSLKDGTCHTVAPSNIQPEDPSGAFYRCLYKHSLPTAAAHSPSAAGGREAAPHGRLARWRCRHLCSPEPRHEPCACAAPRRGAQAQSAPSPPLHAAAAGAAVVPPCR